MQTSKESEYVRVKVPKDWKAALKRIAKKKDLTLSQMLRRECRKRFLEKDFRG